MATPSLGIADQRALGLGALRLAEDSGRAAGNDVLSFVLRCMSNGQVIGSQVFNTGLSWTFVGLESSLPFDEVFLDEMNAGGGDDPFLLDNLRFE